MTPKEEAKELVNKFVKQPIDFPYIDAEHDHCIGSGYMTHNSAKQCALIAVNVILSRCIDEEEQYILYKHWQEVKQEIEKL